MHKNNILIQSSCEATASIKKGQEGSTASDWLMTRSKRCKQLHPETNKTNQANKYRWAPKQRLISVHENILLHFPITGHFKQKITTSVHYTNIKTSVYKCASLTETDVQFCSALGRWSLTCFRTCSQSVQVELSTVDLLAPTQSHGFTTEALRAAAFGHSRAALSVSVWRLSHRMIHVPLSLSANTWREEPAVSREKQSQKVL